MARLKTLYEASEAHSNMITTSNGTPISLDGAQTFSVQCNVDVNTPAAKTFDSGAANVSTTETVADLGVKEVSDITCVADVAESLQSTYFNYETKNLGGATVNLRYAWINVDDGGIDPAPAGRTGIEVPIAADASADDVASAIRTALAADTLVTITGATDHVIITNDYMGNVVNAANGVASPGFSYVITPGVASNLNNSFFRFSETANAVNYAAWYNINGEGTAPVIAGSPTLIEVTAVLSRSANDIAGDSRTAIDGAIGAAIVVSGATNQIILTNSTRGTCTATANGAVSPGFTIANSPAGANTEVDTATDSVTIPTHGLTTGLKGQLTTTGTLPAGLSLATDYFIIAVDANTVQFASSLANALAETEIDITDTGADNSVNTFTATSIAGANVKLQKSNDNSNWSDEGSATNITADGLIYLEKIDPTAKYMRTQFTLTAGSMSSTQTYIVKGLD